MKKCVVGPALRCSGMARYAIWVLRYIIWVFGDGDMIWVVRDGWRFSLGGLGGWKCNLGGWGWLRGLVKPKYQNNLQQIAITL